MFLALCKRLNTCHLTIIWSINCYFCFVKGEYETWGRSDSVLISQTGDERLEGMPITFKIETEYLGVHYTVLYDLILL